MAMQLRSETAVIRGPVVRLFGLLLLALVLAGCFGSSSSSDSSSSSQATEPTSGGDDNTDSHSSKDPTDSAIVTPSCSKIFSSDPGLINFAFPDDSAEYWFAVLPAIPGAQYTIEGRFPDARYFSFNAYDPLLRPTDVITDFEITPSFGEENPFANLQADSRGDYSLDMRLEPRPDQREENTLYVEGVELAEGVDLPSSQIVVLYRIYVAEGTETGNVSLPQIKVSAPGVDRHIFGFAGCDLTNLPSAQVINDVVAELPNPLPALDLDLIPFSEAQPQFRKFYGLPHLVATLLDEATFLGMPSPLDFSLADQVEPDEGGFLSNLNINYVYSAYSRDKGNMYVVRARAPTHRGSVPFSQEQTRYWSLCTNEFLTQRYVDCVRDEQVALDDDGFFTVVVSDPNNRPDNAIEENDITWLPWGAPYFNSVLIYRHMLPDEHFPNAIQAIDFGQDEADVMGEFYPQTYYCDRETVESAGGNASDVFDACAAAQ